MGVVGRPSHHGGTLLGSRVQGDQESGCLRTAQRLRQGRSCHHLALSPACAEVSPRATGSPRLGPGRGALAGNNLVTMQGPCRPRAAQTPAFALPTRPECAPAEPAKPARGREGPTC